MASHWWESAGEGTLQERKQVNSEDQAHSFLKTNSPWKILPIKPKPLCETSFNSFMRALMTLPPLTRHHFLKVPPLNTITLGKSTRTFGEQTTAIPNLIM